MIPTVDEETAWRKLHRGRGWFSAFLLADAREARDGNTRLPKLEIVWLPGYHVVHAVSRRQEKTELHTLVGVQDRDVAVFDPAATRWQSVSDRELFRPRVTPAEAESLAREALARGVLRRGGARLEQTIAIEPVHHPFWAYYHERRRGRLDVRLLDAVTGSVAGPRAKAAFLAALEAAAK